MIISHTYKYCFFSVPRTASTAISQYLKANCDGHQKGKKHSSYESFLQTAVPEERQYFTFAGVRHPMDSAVSEYFKKKSDHNGKFSRGHFKNGRPINPEAMERYQYLQGTNASFSDYFLKFYTKPYGVGFYEHTLRYMDHIIRYEHLNADFQHVLSSLGIKSGPPPLTPVNPTRKKAQEYWTFYTPEALDRARDVFAFFMGLYGYKVPGGGPL
ncbi:MAG: sulfotransferase family 2 domain-containing protein [Phaeodactylibacter sp.]|uniref:sulfotransferase family 2 domain-containing protein n=1 Tax=Phaeodactylibacter sp. TaxID=1940289 RepID=UPI0032EF1C96